MFEDKKRAEEHDKYLELAANITQLIEQEIKGLSEAHGEAIGLLLAKRRDILAKACKGKPEVLLETFQEPAAEPMDTENTKDAQGDDKVTAFAASR